MLDLNVYLNGFMEMNSTVCGIVYALDEGKRKKKQFVTSARFQSSPRQQNPASERSKRSLLAVQTAQCAVKKIPSGYLPYM